MAQTVMNMYTILFSTLKSLSNHICSDWQDPVFISILNGNNFYILFPPCKNTMDECPVPNCNHRYPSNDDKHKPQRIIHISQEKAQLQNVHI
jgi:hypothetical protein